MQHYINQINQKIIPEKLQEGDELLRDNENGLTVAMFLVLNGYDVPDYWKHDPLFRNYRGDTVAMYYACRGCDVPDYWKHDSSIQNTNGYTTAMCYSNSDVDKIPEHWRHEPELQDNSGFTVAMYLAIRDKEIPEYWRHDPTIRNNYGCTVGKLLCTKTYRFWQMTKEEYLVYMTLGNKTESKTTEEVQ